MSTASVSPESPTERANRVAISVALALFASWFVYKSIESIILGTEPIPFWDQWLALGIDDFPGHLFAQHNEHRIAFPRVVFAIDRAWFRGTNRFDVAVIVTISIIHAFLLGRAATASADSSRRWLVPAVAFALCCTLSLDAWENFTWGFQVQFVVVYLFATCAFGMIADPSHRVGTLVAACVFAWLAAFSMANGVLVPLLVVVLAALVRPRRQVLAAALLAVATLAFYLHGYERPGHHGNPVEALQHPWLLARYVAVYLGAPLAVGQVDALRAATNAGLVAIALSAVVAVDLIARRRSVGVREWVLPFVILFVIGTASVTALGRYNFDVAQALASRYQTPSLVFWCALVLYGASRAKGTTARIATSLVVVAFVYVLAGGQSVGRENLLHHAEELRRAEAALLADASAVDALHSVCPDPNVVLDDAPGLRRAGAAPFHDPWARWLGTPLSSHLHRDDGACRGAFDETTAVLSVRGAAFEVRGWAYLPREGTRPRHVVIVDADDRVVGYAFTGVSRLDVVRAIPEITNVKTGFSGYVGSRVRHGTTIRAFAVLEDRRSACLLPGQFRIEPEQELHVARLDEVDSRSAVEGQPTLNGFVESGTPAVVGRPPFGVVFGSYAGTDAATGSMTWSGCMRPEDSALVLPVVVGPGTHGAPIQVRDADSGANWSVLSDPRGFQSWQPWRINVPRTSARRCFVIEGADAGAEWGQWIAIATPRVIVATP